MITILISFIFIVLAIIITIIVHESGHFVVARLLNIQVTRFVIGFGKPLFSHKTRAGIEYVLSAIPIGGYVRMLDEREQPVAEAMQHRAFNRQSITTRALVLIAGPMMNIIFAFVLFYAVAVIGYNAVKPVIAEVIPATPLALADVQAPQTIVAIDGWQTPDWRTAALAILSRVGDKDSMFVILKNNKDQLQFYIVDLAQWRLDNLKPDPVKSLGIIPMDPKTHPEIRYFQRSSAMQAIFVAGQETYRFVKFNSLVLYKVVVGKISLRSLAGPISLVLVASKAFAAGFIAFLLFVGILNIAVAIMNFLPIPGLDGGQLLMLIIEKIRGKAPSLAAQVLAYRLGMIIIFIFISQVLINDLMRVTH